MDRVNTMIDLTAYPRVALGHLPTPLEPLPRLSATLGGPEIWIKRDDCTGLAGGGNKTRKLEFLMGDALNRVAESVITVGALQSNHVRQTAAAAARLGLHCEVVLTDKVDHREDAYRTSGNVLLDDLLGAYVHVVKDGAASDAKVAEVRERLRAENRPPYVVPIGGSNWVGAIGYVNCADEIEAQARQLDLRFDLIVHASSSAGTQSGLLAGLQALRSRTQVLGVNVDSKDPAPLVTRIETLTGALTGRLGAPEVAVERIRINSDYIGSGYGQPTPEMVEAVRMVSEFEGILLDPVYTGKAMSALIGLIRTGGLDSRTRRVLFLHTGGYPGLFAYTEALRTGR